GNTRRMPSRPDLLVGSRPFPAPHRPVVARSSVVRATYAPRTSPEAQEGHLVERRGAQAEGRTRVVVDGDIGDYDGFGYVPRESGAGVVLGYATPELKEMQVWLA